MEQFNLNDIVLKPAPSSCWVYLESALDEGQAFARAFAKRNWKAEGTLRATDSAAGRGDGTAASAYEYRRFQSTAVPFDVPLRFPGQYFDNETELTENWNHLRPRRRQVFAA